MKERDEEKNKKVKGVKHVYDHRVGPVACPPLGKILGFDRICSPARQAPIASKN